MTPTWYIQSSISYHTLEPLHDAFEALDMTYVQVPTIPFKQELPDDVEYISPAIPFGGCSRRDIGQNQAAAFTPGGRRARDGGL